jgi:hypothetical protein
VTHRDYLLLVTAVVEGATAAALLAVPALPIALLLGVEQPAPEALFIGRVTGAALLSFSVACVAGWGESRGSARLGLLLAVLNYDVAAAALLLYAGLTWAAVGVALWPAVAVHLALAVWCGACLVGKSEDRESRPEKAPPGNR